MVHPSIVPDGLAKWVERRNGVGIACSYCPGHDGHIVGASAFLVQVKRPCKQCSGVLDDDERLLVQVAKWYEAVAVREKESHKLLQRAKGQQPQWAHVCHGGYDLEEELDERGNGNDIVIGRVRGQDFGRDGV